MNQTNRLGLFIAAGTLIFLLFILVTAGVLFLVSSRLGLGADTPNIQLISNPKEMLDVTQIDPAMALVALGGVFEADIIIEAIDKARLETALSILLFQPTLSDKETASDFLMLAAAYINTGKINKGVFCYQMAGNIAIISPDMPDTIRSDIFIQISEGLIKSDNPILAKFYMGQAFLLASQSPFLQAVHRRSIFERLQKNYIILNERKLARKSLELSANPPSSTPLAENRTVLINNESVPLPEQIQEAEANRWLKAQELTAMLVERGGHSPQANIEAVKEALIIEDSLKLSFYNDELAATTRLSRKIDVTIAKIEWLSIKYRMAKRAYGISMIPEWEAEAEQIQADLSGSYKTLFLFYSDLIIALPELSRIDKAVEEKLRRELLGGELGRYPDYPREERKNELLEVTKRLINTQPEIKLFIGVKQFGKYNIYALISNEPEG